MAATLTPTKIVVSLKLNNGTTTTGAVKTVSLSLGAISLTGYTDAHALALANDLEGLLDKSVVRVDVVKTGELVYE